jgi:hypothetical protein
MIDLPPCTCPVCAWLDNPKRKTWGQVVLETRERASEARWEAGGRAREAQRAQYQENVDRILQTERTVARVNALPEAVNCESELLG